MARRIILVVLLVVLLAFGWVWYRNWQTTKALNSGNVYSDNSSAPTQTSDGSVPTPTSVTNQPPAAKSTAGNTSTTFYPTADGSPPQSTVAQQPSPAAQLANQVKSLGAPSATDTVAPNPPNGLAFGGTGRFQWYRQGNLTWRVNTETGAACIMFATDEEWRKPRVYQHGCGNS